MSKSIVTHLRQWGLKVEPVPGWQTRHRPYAFKPRAIIPHHDASAVSSGNDGAIGIVTHGRSDLPGPLAQFFLCRDGTVKVVSDGYCNHAGYGGPKAGVPRNLGNTYAWGIEAANNGVGEKWSKAQLNAYYRLCAALLAYMGTKDVKRVFGHKEWTPRKIDPAGISMNDFRKRVAEALAAGPSVTTIHLSKLKPGNRNTDVLNLKIRLAKRGFGGKNRTKFFGKGLREDYRKWQRHLGYEGKEVDGLPSKASLRKLGFRVVP